MRSCKSLNLAERGGFEPPIQFYPYNGLANQGGISSTYICFRNRFSINALSFQ
jgi:hypothetical protein